MPDLMKRNVDTTPQLNGTKMQVVTKQKRGARLPVQSPAIRKHGSAPHARWNTKLARCYASTNRGRTTDIDSINWSTLPTSSDVLTFGQRVRQVRIERGLSLNKVAELSEGLLSPSGMLRIENDVRTNPKLTTLVGLARSLDSVVTITADGVSVEPRRRGRT